MASDIIKQLQELKPDLNNSLPKNVLIMFQTHLQNSGINPSQLINPVQLPNARWGWKPKFGPASLNQPKNRHAEQKVATLEAGHETNFTYIKHGSTWW